MLSDVSGWLWTCLDPLGLTLKDDDNDDNDEDVACNNDDDDDGDGDGDSIYGSDLESGVQLKRHERLRAKMQSWDLGENLRSGSFRSFSDRYAA